MNVVVGICTCRNPHGLEKLLDALAVHKTSHEFRVILVDNDVDGAGAPIAQKFKTAFDLTYLQEITPGIPFARNALIEAVLKDDFGFLLMIDDDEQPLPGWLDRMIQAAEQTGASVVGGPVTPVFEDSPEPPVERSDFEKLSPALLAGRLAIDSTANILFTGDLLREWPGIFFDPRFQFSGGSDSELLRRISAAGHNHAWAENAYVAEDIPTSRCDEGWLLKRNYRNGNVLGRVTVFHQGRREALLKVLPRALVLWFRGSIRSVTSGNDLRKNYLAKKDKARASGMLAALNGKVMQEYAASNYR
jgi:succinoglycan biosynthesis protein ExoM